MIQTTRQRIFPIALIACLAFVSLTWLAMLLYPGGTFLDPLTDGYSFTNNFFSELGMTTANNCQGSLWSALFFLIALTLAGVGLVAYHLVMPAYFRHRKVVYWISVLGSVCGVIAGLCFIGVAFSPVNLANDLHTIFVMNAFRAYMLAAILYTIATFMTPRYPNIYGWVGLLFAALMVTYVIILTYGPEIDTNQGYVMQVVSQKAIVYASIFNMLIQSWGATKNKQLASDI